jgi:hypothetical protein
MQLEGRLLDISFRDDEALLWLKTESTRIQLTDRYYPDVFVVPEKCTFDHFIDLFDEYHLIQKIEKTERFLSIGNPKKTSVLRVFLSTIEKYRAIIKQL